MARPTQGIGAAGTPNYCRAVDISTGEELFVKHLGNQTINIGEFLAVVEAVRYILENDYYPRVIFTDSATAIAWFKQKHTASKKRNSALLKAEVFLKAFAVEIATIELHHWDNHEWGEIPADFGEK